MTAVRQVTRRDLLKSFGLAAAGTALAACAAPAAPPPASPQVIKETVIVEKKETVVVPQEKQKVTISWWNQFSTETCQRVFPQVVNDFQDLNPWITVDYEISGGPPGGGDYTEVLLSRIAAGNPPDTATLWTPPVQFAARGSLAGIDDYMAQAKWAKPGSFYEAPLKSCQWRGQTFGLPASAANSAIFINKNLFEAKGISTKPEDMPKTWEELRALSAEFVAYDGGVLQQAGFVPWGAGGNWTYPLWSALNGGKVFDDKAEQYALNSDENINMLESWVAWLDEQYQGDIEALNAEGDWSSAYPGTPFYMERLAMIDGGIWGITDAPMAMPFDMFKYPVGPKGKSTFTAWWPNWFALPKGGPNSESGFLFIEYMCTKGWITWYEQGAMDTSPWVDFPPDTMNIVLVDMVGLERAKEIVKFFNEYLADGCVMWNSPIEDFVSNTIGSSVDEVLHKVKTPKQALDEAQALATEKLQQVLSGG